MKTSMQSKLDQLTRRLAELNQMLSQEDVTADMDQYRKLTRENAEIGPVVEQYALWRNAFTDETTAQELLADPSMPCRSPYCLLVACRVVPQRSPSVPTFWKISLWRSTLCTGIARVREAGCVQFPPLETRGWGFFS